MEEVMRECTPERTGVRGQTSKERSAEITLGRTYIQQGLAATCKDWIPEHNSKGKQRIIGLAHERVVAMKVG